MPKLSIQTVSKTAIRKRLQNTDLQNSGAEFVPLKKHSADILVHNMAGNHSEEQ